VGYNIIKKLKDLKLHLGGVGLMYNDYLIETEEEVEAEVRKVKVNWLMKLHRWFKNYIRETRDDYLAAIVTVPIFVGFITLLFGWEILVYILLPFLCCASVLMLFIGALSFLSRT